MIAPPTAPPMPFNNNDWFPPDLREETDGTEVRPKGFHEWGWLHKTKWTRTWWQGAQAVDTSWVWVWWMEGAPDD